VLVEGEQCEVKSEFTGAKEQILKIVKTIVAFANTKGGTIWIERVEGEAARQKLDSARLDDAVNKYVSPRVSGIESSPTEENGMAWKIHVPKSPDAPHVFVEQGTYRDGRGRTKTVFHPGQVYARHSSKTEPATGEDLHEIIKSSIVGWLTNLGEAIGRVAQDLSVSETGFPVTITETGLLSIRIKDPNSEYPYTAKSLASKTGKSQNWVAAAAKKLGLKNDKAFCMEIKCSDNKRTLQVRYNERALRLLEERAKDPNFDPYH